jgi:hypothetical protein
MVTRWNGFNTTLHTLAHALNPRFYDKDFITQSNGKRKAPHKDKEVANGVKKAFQRLFPSSQQTVVREEFACFAAGLEDFVDILFFGGEEDHGPGEMVDLSWGKWCIFARSCHSYSITSGKLFNDKKELEHLWLHSFCEAQQVGIPKG